MTDQQKASLLYRLHNISTNHRSETLDTEIKNFGLSDSEIQNERENLQELFSLGIMQLNPISLITFLPSPRKN